jgi:ABC-type multidrug transport system fused ATPase/permease subunit
LAHTETTELSVFRGQARDVFKVGNRLLELAARMNAVVEPTVVLSVLGLVYVWVTILETPLANMGVLVVVMMRLLPLAQETLSNMQAARTYSHSVERLLQMRDSLAEDIEPIDDGVPFPADLGAGIRLSGVSYTYPVNKDEAVPPLALTDITLLIPAGKTTALLGPSGAGKSTLFDLLPRLREPQKGQIWFGDTDARTIALGSLRRHIALVSQEVLLIDGSVADNLRYGNDGASDDEIHVAAKAAFADGFIQALPQGYDTVLGPRGARLSGGQRQRIALARALLARVPILLLDEPTSALDAESELAVQQALEKQQRDHGTTIVIIAHRLSTVNHADLTVVLDQGKVMAVGTHQELMESAPWYQKIVALQH